MFIYAVHVRVIRLLCVVCVVSYGYARVVRCSWVMLRAGAGAGAGTVVVTRGVVPCTDDSEGLAPSQAHVRASSISGTV